MLQNLSFIGPSYFSIHGGPNTKMARLSGRAPPRTQGFMRHGASTCCAASVRDEARWPNSVKIWPRNSDGFLEWPRSKAASRLSRVWRACGSRAFAGGIRNRLNLTAQLLLYKKYKEKVGEILNGEVYQIWKKELLVLDDEGNELIFVKGYIITYVEN